MNCLLSTVSRGRLQFNRSNEAQEKYEGWPEAAMNKTRRKKESVAIKRWAEWIVEVGVHRNSQNDSSMLNHQIAVGCWVASSWYVFPRFSALANFFQHPMLVHFQRTGRVANWPSLRTGLWLAFEQPAWVSQRSHSNWSTLKLESIRSLCCWQPG